MKSNYEYRAKQSLTRRMPVILRLDGRAFHTYTRGFERPFDQSLHDAMIETSRELMSQIQGARMVYTQSDEISILVCDYDRLTSEPWFDFNAQKMCSVGASIATATFNRKLVFDNKTATFDCRAFNIPREEIPNYFYWRWLDCERNSIQMLAQSLFSHKELQGLGRSDLHEKCWSEKGINWADLDDWKKNGTFLVRENIGVEPVTNLREDKSWIATVTEFNQAGEDE